MPRLFALDQNFPQPVLAALGDFIIEAELIPLGDIDSRLTEDMEDWQVLLALHHHAREWDGLITTDSSMLKLPRELATLLQTRLTLVVAEEAGHDPLRATGLLLLHLPSICGDTDPNTSQVWRLRAQARRPPINPWEEMLRVAEHQNTEPGGLYRDHKLSESELASNPLDTPLA